MAWHAQLANVLEQHTGLLRAYNLVITPAIWYGVVFVTCIVTLCYGRSLNDQALLRGLRRLIGLAPMDDDDENPEDAILDDFKTIIDGLNEKLDLIGSQGQKMQNLVSSFSGFADNAKRLAERLIENRHEQFGDEELRKSLVSNVSDVCYEFFTQLKDGTRGYVHAQLGHAELRSDHPRPGRSRHPGGDGLGPALDAIRWGGGAGGHAESVGRRQRFVQRRRWRRGPGICGQLSRGPQPQHPERWGTRAQLEAGNRREGRHLLLCRDLRAPAGCRPRLGWPGLAFPTAFAAAASAAAASATAASAAAAAVPTLATRAHGSGP